MKRKALEIDAQGTGDVSVRANPVGTDYTLTLPPNLPTSSSRVIVSPQGLLWLEPSNNQARTNLAFLNGWSNLDTSFWGFASAAKINGVVHLFGLIKGGTLSPGVPLFQLPVGMRPSFGSHLMNTRCAGNGMVRLDIYDNGFCAYGGEASGSPTSWTTLSGMCFATY